MSVATHASPLARDSLRAMVECWTARNGLPRRFQPGESLDFYAVQAWLQRRGYALGAVKGRFAILSPGKNRHGLSWRQVIELVDELRVAEGLEPYRV